MNAFTSLERGTSNDSPETMNCIESLRQALTDPTETSNHGSTLVGSTKQWNDSLEDHLLSKPINALGPETIDNDLVEETAAILQSRVVFSIVNEPFSTFARDTAHDKDADEAAERAAAHVQKFESSLENMEKVRFLSELLRASKNYLRFLRQLEVELGSVKVLELLRRLTSTGMLKLYVELCKTQKNDSARYASLVLFYSVYNPANDKSIQQLQMDLVDKLDFLHVLMGLMLQARPTTLVLSLLRHVHNLVGSMRDVSKQMDVELMKLAVTQSAVRDAPWVDEGSGDGMCLVSLLIQVTLWYLQSEPRFPGDEADRRSDVVLESLRILYVLRAGQTEPSANRESFKGLICTLLELDSNDSRCYACKLATVSLLIDCPIELVGLVASCGQYEALLDVLDRQVSSVVDQFMYGQDAAVALTPILIVLNKFSSADDQVLQTTKDFIFPVEAEETFQELVAAQAHRAENSRIGAKNMKPLDAPVGTLRWKLIRLMTWTESHVKRLVSELLWTVCDGDAKQFVERTGFGNAMPQLAHKGLVQLPGGETAT